MTPTRTPDPVKLNEWLDYILRQPQQRRISRQVRMLRMRRVSPRRVTTRALVAQKEE